MNYYISQNNSVITDSVIKLHTAGETNEAVSLYYGIESKQQVGVFFLENNGGPVMLSEDDYENPENLESYNWVPAEIKNALENILGEISEKSKVWWYEYADKLEQALDNLVNP